MEIKDIQRKNMKIKIKDAHFSNERGNQKIDSK